MDTFITMPWIKDLIVGELLCETKLLRPWVRDINPETSSGTPSLRSINTFTSSSECKLSKLPAQPECTRYIARRLVQQLADEFGLQLRAAFEIEFVELGDKYGRACASAPASAHRELKLTELCNDFCEVGIDVESFSREFAPGQYELNQKPALGVHSADQAVRTKQAIKESFELGQVTFMPKSRYDQCCNGMHFNFSLVEVKRKESEQKDGDKESFEKVDKYTNMRNAFTESNTLVDCEFNMSDIAKAWITGLMNHCDSLTALCNPTVNCYRRLHNPWTPGKSYWDYDDRHALFRIRRGIEGVFVESRLPSGAANPYLIIAGHLIAGMDGLRNFYKTTETGDNMKFTPNGSMGCNKGLSSDSIKKLPNTLKTALDSLSYDDIMVGGLGKDFVNAFIEIKMQSELNKLKNIDVLKKAENDDDLEEEKNIYLVNA